MSAFDVKVIQTGSSGNCSIIDGHIMVDCGLSKARIGRYLKSEIDRVFITHDHGDHANMGVLNWLARERPLIVSYGLHVNESTLEKMWEKAPEAAALVKSENVVRPGEPISFRTRSGSYAAEPVTCYHDVENYGFIFRNEAGESLVYMTDTISTSACPDEKFDCICLEGNYDYDAVMESLVSSDRGESYRAALNLRHLSVQDFDKFVKSHAREGASIFQLHESEAFGVESELNGLRWLEAWNDAKRAEANSQLS